MQHAAIRIPATAHPMRIAFRSIMAERRAYRHGDPERSWRTNAARKFIWLLRGIPPNQWSE